MSTLALGAVPSQTDFDSTYFLTSSLPISVTGNLTNWQKLSTNAASSGMTGTVSNSVASAGLLAVDATKTNGVAATSAMVQAAAGQVWQATNANLTSWSSLAPSTKVNTSGDTMTGALFTPILSAGQIQLYQDTLTHAGTVTLDFSSTNAHSITLTGNVTFATSNLATNRTCRIRISGTSTNSTPTFPAWHFLTGAPTTITANKFSMLTLEAWGAADSTVMAWFQEEP